LHQPQRNSTAFEDPFSDVVSTFEPTNPDQADPDTPSIDRDNKLLGFSVPHFDYSLLEWTGRRTSISLSAQLHGMFFLAESPWASAADGRAPPSELTCYRRNLFQITGEITVPRGLRYVLTEHGEQIPIMGQELVISATESTEGNPVKIISVPWKTPTNPNIALPEEKAEREPPPVPLDLMDVHHMDTEFATFPIQWKRLQFRIATANNGRRKELQQHFVVRLKVLATLATGGKIPICEIHSGAIIVRGRSPRNFQARKDTPLNAAGHARRVSNLPGAGQPSRAPSGDPLKKAYEAPTSAPVKAEGQAPALPSMFEYHDSDLNEFYNWKGQGETNNNNKGAATAIMPPRTAPHHNAHTYPISSPDLTRSMRPPPAPPSAPINLSLVEDDSPRPTTTSSQTPPDQPPSKRLHIPSRPPSFALNTINSPDESADLLYEYFPLGLDDWMPPVEAVYRPHVVHHTKLPTDPRDPKTGAGKGNRSKRYFSEDVSC
ncbi:p53-like transcription factor, partial [Hortaea werneckii]